MYGYYTIKNITGTRNSQTITGLVDPETGYSGVNWLNDNRISSVGIPSPEGFSYYVGSTAFGQININYDSTNLETLEQMTISSQTKINYSAVMIPFNIPDGATIATLGSILSLSVLRFKRIILNKM